MKAALSGLIIVVLLALCGCWDEPEHELDNAKGGFSGPPPGWLGFGAACETDDDCGGYPGERRCIHNCLGLINTPGGYCTACCDEEGQDVCAQGIDCVGADGVYLICLAHCEKDEDCRQEDGYECREIYYIPDQFPGTYCLPKPELVEPDTDDITNPDCPWPWL